MLKRYASLAAALVLMSTAAACGSNGTESSPAAETSSAAEAQMLTVTETAAAETKTETISAETVAFTEAASVEKTGETEYSMNINEESTFSFKVDSSVWVYAPQEVVHDGTEIDFFRAESGFPVLYVEVKNLGVGGYEEYADSRRSELAPVECSKAEYSVGEVGVVKSHGGEGTVFTEYFIPAGDRYIEFGFCSYEAEYDSDVPKFERIINSVVIN
ncbi:MAG: hypothetical protein K5884_09015 [Ruminococcus sp.]|nr:hypothetical protein [Ruminococcus sp.]